jgi:hypothetical protein
MGYTDNPHEPVSELVREIVHQVPAYCDIRGGYNLIDKIEIDRLNHQIKTGETVLSTGKVIIHQLTEAKKLAFFICTSGKGIGEWSKSLAEEGDIFKSYVVDLMGSVIVEYALDKIHDLLEAEMGHQGLGVTDRYSPGYCDWNVSEQQKIFPLLPAASCGVSLLDSSLMVPVKSISGIIGIGKGAVRKNNTCELCNSINCFYRNRRHR